MRNSGTWFGYNSKHWCLLFCVGTVDVELLQRQGPRLTMVGVQRDWQQQERRTSTGSSVGRCDWESEACLPTRVLGNRGIAAHIRAFEREMSPAGTFWSKTACNGWRVSSPLRAEPCFPAHTAGGVRDPSGQSMAMSLSPEPKPFWRYLPPQPSATARRSPPCGSSAAGGAGPDCCGPGGHEVAGLGAAGVAARTASPATCPAPPSAGA